MDARGVELVESSATKSNPPVETAVVMESLRNHIQSAVMESDVVADHCRGRCERDSHLELRLLYHFTISTTDSLPDIHLSAVKQCWLVDVPRLEFSYPPLLNQIFAISALHLPKGIRTDHKLLASRTSYLERALRQHWEKLQMLTPEMAGAACFTSILLVDTFASL
ncbi:hypothetical protein ETB97_008457 [Aspergillus alliaceus]|uniref:Uncharacterized protein n=1 Tax=Petromyces alliaceus TaxID=209559 RepID=A0A8H5ZSZ9_PETAA|nr:hypothetical protein ETB97_008457 [Aspergillus burnettii]